MEKVHDIYACVNCGEIDENQELPTIGNPVWRFCNGCDAYYEIYASRDEAKESEMGLK